MTTREEIEAALSRRSTENLRAYWKSDPINGEYFDEDQAGDDADTLADAFCSEQAERQRWIEAAAEAIIADCNTHDMYRDLIVHIITRHLEGETT